MKLNDEYLLKGIVQYVGASKMLQNIFFNTSLNIDTDASDIPSENFIIDREHCHNV